MACERHVTNHNSTLLKRGPTIFGHVLGPHVGVELPREDVAAVIVKD